MKLKRLFDPNCSYWCNSLLPSFAFSTFGKESNNSITTAEIEFWQLSGMRNPSEGFVGWIQSNPSQVYENAQQIRLIGRKKRVCNSFRTLYKNYFEGWTGRNLRPD